MAEKTKTRDAPLSADQFKELVLDAKNYATEQEQSDAVKGKTLQPSLGSTHIREARRVWRQLHEQFSGSEAEVLGKLLKSSEQRTSVVRIVTRRRIMERVDDICSLIKNAGSVRELIDQLDENKFAFLNEKRHIANRRANSPKDAARRRQQDRRRLLEVLKVMAAQAKASLPPVKAMRRLSPRNLAVVIGSWLNNKNPGPSKASKNGKSPN